MTCTTIPKRLKVVRDAKFLKSSKINNFLELRYDSQIQNASKIIS
jgi:hypothetical protein